MQHWPPGARRVTGLSSGAGGVLAGVAAQAGEDDVQPEGDAGAGVVLQLAGLQDASEVGVALLVGDRAQVGQALLLICLRGGRGGAGEAGDVAQVPAATTPLSAPGNPPLSRSPPANCLPSRRSFSPRRSCPVTTAACPCLTPAYDRIGRFTLAIAATQVVSSHPRTDLFSPALSMLVLIAWPAAALLAAALLITRRDA